MKGKFIVRAAQQQWKMQDIQKYNKKYKVLLMKTKIDAKV